jgi:hypothetical protein
MSSSPDLGSQSGMTESPVPARCRAPAHGDALDRELANRLNARLAGTERSADYMQSLRPVFGEIACWAVATGCLTAAAAFWLV